MTESFIIQIEQELGEFGIILDIHQIEQFFKYYEMLIETNKVMNLTSIVEESEVVTKHFSDSLSLIRAFGGMERIQDFFGKDGSIIDVGTGAGFPGIPLKIAFPEIRLTLLDSLNKRIKFLQKVTDALGLKDTECIHGRAEDIGRQVNHREKYHLCVSRAVANISSLSEYCMPFVKVGGFFISYKSGEIEDELQNGKTAVKILGGEIEKVEKFLLPASDLARSLIVIKKVNAISKKYPRKAGMPMKEPLG